jgi:hypothetical protein
MANKEKKTINKKVRSNANIWNLADERLMADTAVKNLIKAEEELKVLLEAKKENGITQELINELKEHSTYKTYAEKERNKARKGFGLDKEETDNLTCDLLNKINISEDTEK